MEVTRGCAEPTWITLFGTKGKTVPIMFAESGLNNGAQLKQIYGNDVGDINQIKLTRLPAADPQIVTLNHLIVNTPEGGKFKFFMKNQEWKQELSLRLKGAKPVTPPSDDDDSIGGDEKKDEEQVDTDEANKRFGRTALKSEDLAQIQSIKCATTLSDMAETLDIDVTTIKVGDYPN